MGERFINYVLPDNVEEAYEALQSRRTSRLIGGGCFVKLGEKKIVLAVDLSKSGLDYINELENEIEIGGMTSLRTFETSKLLKENFGDIIEDSVKNIIGVQLRNIASIGGTVFPKFGFSDPLTALLALDADIYLHGDGRISLEDFLKEKTRRKDILEKVILKKNVSRGSFQSIRNSAVDYAILNVAVGIVDGEYRIAVGARPRRATLALEAMEFLNNNELNEENIIKTSNIVGEELHFGTNTRGSAEYRKELSKVLTKRALMEVSKWK
ncbi:MAG TPA: FAD binding domain-containing protein [Tissierellaceae bacterium]|nr:FAD binding domain-containing protein [Tissierellaceae bacterium]